MSAHTTIGGERVRTDRFYVEVEGGLWSMTRAELTQYLEASIARGAFVGDFGRALKTRAISIPTAGGRWVPALPAHLRRGHIGLHTLDWPVQRFRGALRALRAENWRELLFGTFEDAPEES